MGEQVNLKIHNHIGVITIDNPPVNAYTQAVRAGIMDALDVINDDDHINAAVIIGTGSMFSAGMDINEFQEGFKDPDFRSVLEGIENSPKVVVAAMQGSAIGGGFELAMWSHYRCAVPAGKVLLPEVKLGILPGAGGTQRLPRLIGVKKALDMCITGGALSTKEAAEAGVIDKIIEGDFLEGALEYVESLIAGNAPIRRTRDITIDASDLPNDFFQQYRKKFLPGTKGYFAPERIIQCVEAAVRLPYEEGDKREITLFFECLNSSQSKALVYLFFAERDVGKIPDISADTQQRSVKKIAVIGSGTMGGGIAMNFANIGIPVQLLEISEDLLNKGLTTIRNNYETTSRKGRLTENQVNERLKCISGTTIYDDIADADLVIEAVFENMKIKKQVFKKLDEVMKPGAILATNTSTLDINEIAASVKRPQDVIGLHFFSPANVMRLLEVIRTKNTAEDVIKTSMALAKSIKKIAVLSGVCFGFIGNRMAVGYVREADLLLLEGASPSQVDKAILDFGFPMGPCAMNDLAGVDIGHKVRQENQDILPDDERFCLIGDKLAERGRLGQKSGAGYYKYEPGDRKPLDDPEVLNLIRAEADRLNIEQREITNDEIIERCIYALINEGARILEEGIAIRSSDIDIVYVNGYGFPPYRGGPMHYADSIGLDHVLTRIRGFAEKDPAFWQPALLLETLVADGKSFRDI